MFCPKCGKKVADGTAFCPSCGTELAGKLVEVEKTKKKNIPFMKGLRSFLTKPSMRKWRFVSVIAFTVVLILIISMTITKSCRRRRFERTVEDIYESLLIPQQEFNFYWNYNMYDRVVQNFTFSNLTDYTMSEVCFYLNNEIYPFYTCSSLALHGVLKVNRWQYKPKISTEDKIKITCIIGGKTKIAVIELWQGKKQ